MRYPTDFINKFIRGDCLEVMKSIPDNTIDCVVTSPPYNMGKMHGYNWEHNKIDYGLHVDDMPEPKYQDWQKTVIRELVRIIKPDGSIFYNHKPRSRNHKLILPTEWTTEFDIRQVIIWNRNGAVNRSPITFQQNTEWILWIKKTIPKFNPDYFKYGEVWNVSFTMNTDHPAPFPIEIPFRCIQATTSKNAIVLDPFSGSGTTAVACKKSGRNFIGIELNPEYIVMAERRLLTYTPMKPSDSPIMTL